MLVMPSSIRAVAIQGRKRADANAVASAFDFCLALEKCCSLLTKEMRFSLNTDRDAMELVALSVPLTEATPLPRCKKNPFTAA